MKYVIVRGEQGEQAILFSEGLTHASVADGQRLEVVSAGFCFALDGLVVADGESESLKVRSRTGDAAVIQRSLEAMKL